MSLKANIAASYLGQTWAAIMGVAFLPLYAQRLGIEAFALIGVFAVLQAAMTLLDFGLTPTVMREMARLRGGAHDALSIRNLLRSIEVLITLFAAGMTIVVWFGSAYIARDWLTAENVPDNTVAYAIKTMGFVLAVRSIEQIYRGVLQGLQDLRWLNVVVAFMATARWGGAYLVVVWGPPSVISFFTWQGAISLITVVVLLRRSYKLLPPASEPTRFSLSSLRSIRGFASGMSIAALLTFLLTQGDKLVVSRLLTLTDFGYYTLAAALAGGLVQLIVPMNNAVYPRLTEQIARGDVSALTRTYLAACEWMAVVIVPPALLLAFFSEQVLLLWTGDPNIARAAAPLLSVLALGTLFNGFVNLPYMLQLAYGWTSISIVMNVTAIAVLFPCIIWAVPRFGAIGAAMAWLALNAGYVLLTAHFMHRRILRETKWRWYRVGVVRPLAIGVAMAALLWKLLPGVSTRGEAGVIVATCSALIAVAVVMCSPHARIIVRRMFNSGAGA